MWRKKWRETQALFPSAQSGSGPSTGFDQTLLTAMKAVITEQLLGGPHELSRRLSLGSEQRGQRSNAVSVAFQAFSPPLLGFKLVSVISAPKTILSPGAPSALPSYTYPVLLPSPPSPSPVQGHVLGKTALSSNMASSPACPVEASSKGCIFNILKILGHDGPFQDLDLCEPQLYCWGCWGAVLGVVNHTPKSQTMPQRICWYKSFI